MPRHRRTGWTLRIWLSLWKRTWEMRSKRRRLGEQRDDTEEKRFKAVPTCTCPHRYRRYLRHAKVLRRAIDESSWDPAVYGDVKGVEELRNSRAIRDESLIAHEGDALSDAVVFDRDIRKNWNTSRELMVSQGQKSCDFEQPRSSKGNHCTTAAVLQNACWNLSYHGIKKQIFSSRVCFKESVYEHSSRACKDVIQQRGKLGNRMLRKTLDTPNTWSNSICSRTYRRVRFYINATPGRRVTQRLILRLCNLHLKLFIKRNRRFQFTTSEIIFWNLTIFLTSLAIISAKEKAFLWLLRTCSQHFKVRS